MGGRREHIFIIFIFITSTDLPKRNVPRVEHDTVTALRQPGSQTYWDHLGWQAFKEAELRNKQRMAGQRE